MHQLQITIRPLSEHDSLEQLTALLHRAYAPLAAMGFRYYASHQTVEQTRDRIKNGFCLVAEMKDRLVGTITWYRGRENHSFERYRDPNIVHFGQFGVEPDLQHHGIGLRLLRQVEESAKQAGCTTIALDTAEGAAHLVNWYTRMGFEVVDYTKWDVTNYRSVVLSKPLG